MKILLPLLLLTIGAAHAQSVPMVQGQPFPFREGIAMSKATADSTRGYVGILEDSLLAIKRERVDLRFQLSSLAKERGEYSKALALCQTQFDNQWKEQARLTKEIEKQTTKVKSRFWIGTTAGIAIAFVVSSILKK
ncbi:hypothetical protein [Runella limosa]|uniref:hypothetical protein n=1 Tax=Runella limosa TaxID=370978 RepID=UPI0004267B9D|nr:hypothetical protein [Runella limosa]